ncbi:flagellar motor protein MotB [Halobacillus salinarum]|uniref:Flagellar motor protein MotB n=1 Tax=Halobacillus salinarum TaxID=2932257 RepID=A0ABY4EGZ7_9BACI|nr:flagellar motor protein MotB [Halobacillus salinarum]UOQ43332.1 flagellar motor protein MotB [Halobacillus salinarum]
MARKKKRKSRLHEDNHTDESWLVPYADILTLLLALFIVLFASSTIDKEKFQAIANSFNSVLNGGESIIENNSLSKTTNVEEIVQKEHESQTQQAAEHEKLEKLQETINEYITENELTDLLQTKLTKDGLLVTLQDNALFDSGSAQVRSEDKHVARELSKMLVFNPPRKIVISGHTDNQPIKNAAFDNNWHLSVMRSINFMKVLLENKDLDPSYLSARGLGEFEPIASNETKEGRAKNRRVEVLILPNLKEG